MSKTKSLSLHQQIQGIITKELEQLPEMLEALTPAERVRALIQLLPYAAPKVETCREDYGEEMNWGWGSDNG